MLKFFSIFSGIYFEIPESYVQHMDCGQIPIEEFPKENCKSCYGRGYTGIDTKTGHYSICKCLLATVKPERVIYKQVEDIPLNLKYEN
jgi:hypothetical protein